VSTKLPPVELERVTITLVAFTESESATEPDFIVKLTAGEVKENTASELHRRGAAASRPLHPSGGTGRKKMGGVANGGVSAHVLT
jgi:hypothetical protein